MTTASTHSSVRVVPALGGVGVGVGEVGVDRGGRHHLTDGVLRMMGVVLLNLALVNITVGGILVLLGLAGAALLNAVDAFGDAAAAFGAAVGHDRTRHAAILEQAAAIRAIHAKAGADEARAAGPPIPVFGAPVMAGNGHGRYEDEEWTG